MSRREIAVLADGVAFAFGAAEPSASEVLKLSERFEQIRDDIVGTDKRLLIVSGASSPGSDDFNQALSDQRGEWLKGWLVEQGVGPNQIEVRSTGERHADQIGDSAFNRVALWQVEDALEATAVEPSAYTLLEERFADDRAVGERKFLEATDPFADLIRELYSLPENPTFPDPSANPVHLLKQALGVAFDFFGPPTSAEEVAVEGIANKGKGIDVIGPPGPLDIAKGAAGIAVGVARENMTGDVADARRPLFDALEEATAAALDSNYKLNLEGMDPASRALAIALYNRLVELPYLDRYQIALFLAVTQVPPELSDLEGKLDGTTFRRGADFVFSGSDYSYRSNDPGIRSLFGLKFEEVDGQLRVVDNIAGQVISSAVVGEATHAADDVGGVSLPGDDGIVGLPEDVGGVSLPGDDGIVGLPEDVGGVSLPGDDGIVGLPEDVGGVSLPGDDAIVGLPDDDGGMSLLDDDDGGMSLPDDDGGMSFPGDDDGGMSLPDDDGGMSLPDDDDGGMSLPDDDGGMSFPGDDDGGMSLLDDDDGGMSLPGDDDGGGISLPGDDGGVGVRDDDGGMNLPDDDDGGGISLPDDDGGVSLPDDDGGVCLPGDDGGVTPPDDAEATDDGTDGVNGSVGGGIQ